LKEREEREEVVYSRRRNALRMRVNCDVVPAKNIGHSRKFVMILGLFEIDLVWFAGNQKVIINDASLVSWNYHVSHPSPVSIYVR